MTSTAENFATIARRRRGRRGFTLLELVLIMILICTALAVSAPDLRGFSAGSKMKNAAQQVLALTNYARTQAASEGRTYRLNFENGTYFVTALQDDQFVQDANSMGQSFPVPDGVQVQLARDDNQPLNYIEFHPDGRTDVARVRLWRDNQELYVVCASPSERFHVASTPEVQR